MIVNYLLVILYTHAADIDVRVCEHRSPVTQIFYTMQQKALIILTRERERRGETLIVHTERSHDIIFYTSRL